MDYRQNDGGAGTLYHTSSTMELVYSACQGLFSFVGASVPYVYPFIYQIALMQILNDELFFGPK